jgi:hypothetical protein
MTDAPLPVPAYTSTTSIKRRLDTAFGQSIEAAHKLTTTMMAAKHDKIQPIQKLLSVVGKACGYCIAKGHPNPTDHFGAQCPSMSLEMRKAFKMFRTSMIYPEDFKGSRPCFYCHVCSMGNDKLHPEFRSRASKECPNPHAAVQIAFAVYHDQTLRNAAAQHFTSSKGKLNWRSIQSFKDWIISEDDTYSTKTMALLAWYASYRHI